MAPFSSNRNSTHGPVLVGLGSVRDGEGGGLGPRLSCWPPLGYTPSLQEAFPDKTLGLSSTQHPVVSPESALEACQLWQ